MHDAINRLAKIGAEVLHEENAPRARLGPRARRGAAHDARRSLRPKAVMPIHGEFRMLAAHARLAREGGRAGETRS